MNSASENWTKLEFFSLVNCYAWEPRIEILVLCFVGSLKFSTNIAGDCKFSAKNDFSDFYGLEE